MIYLKKKSIAYDMIEHDIMTIPMDGDWEWSTANSWAGWGKSWKNRARLPRVASYSILFCNFCHWEKMLYTLCSDNRSWSNAIPSWPLLMGRLMSYMMPLAGFQWIMYSSVNLLIPTGHNQKINENNADEDAKGMVSLFVSNAWAKLISGL